MEYKELEEELEEIKMYAKRTIDLYTDAKKWCWLAKHSETAENKDKYMNVANTLMELFYKEVENMKL